MNKKYIIAIVCLIVLMCAFAVWKLQSPTTSVFVTPTANQAALAQLQTDMQNVTPHFIDASKTNGHALTPEEQKIKDDAVALFVAGVFKMV